MLKPLDRHRRDSTLFQFTTRRLRDFIDPDHLLIRIDEQFCQWRRNSGPLWLLTFSKNVLANWPA